MDQNCTTTQYAGQGCIGTATSTHSVLPFTGLDVVTVALMGAIILVCAIILRLRTHA